MLKKIKRVEDAYGVITSYTFRALNPFKKMIIHTEAQVHKFNNREAVKLLKTYGYIKEYYLFRYYLMYMNNGTKWADQDFKSSSHFYNPFIMKGLFGQPHSKRMTIKYYKKAKAAWKHKNYEKAMFFLGASTHIIQDLTVPHHVVNRLLDSHRQYENFVKLTYDIVKDYRTDQPPIVFSNIEEYVEYNAGIAYNLYKRYNHLRDKRVKYYKWTRVNLPLSHRTTAGCFLMFLEDVGYYKRND
jgi:phospholipase C